jgi:hypothetical protein
MQIARANITPSSASSERSLKTEDSVNPPEVEYEVQTYHLRIQTLSVSLTNHSVANTTWTIGVWAIDKKRYIIPPMKIQPQCSEDGKVNYICSIFVQRSPLIFQAADTVSRDYQLHPAKHR